MRHSPISSELYVQNRKRLVDLTEPKSLAVVHANDLLPTNADGSAPYFPNSDLFYLTGVEQEESVLLLSPGAHDEKLREILFLRETSELIAQWEGRKLTLEEARAQTGIANVKWLSEFPKFLRILMCEAEHVYLNTNEHPRAVIEVETRNLRFIRSLQAHYPLHDYRRLAPLLHRLRSVKSPLELDWIREAAEITRRSYDRVLQFVKPGVREYEVEAEFAHEYVRNRARFAYTPIIASGANACVLHYISNDQPCNDGDLLLLDVAAAYANYNADVTRTIPVNGRFTSEQRKVYEAVLRTLRHMSDALQPGKLPSVWQKEAEAFMRQELLELGLLSEPEIAQQTTDRPAVKKYFMHGIGHPLGLDVHDVSAIGAPFQAGWVMTVEPGIYIAEKGIGIRLENDILITENGNVNLTESIPIEPDHVEAAMAR